VPSSTGQPARAPRSRRANAVRVGALAVMLLALAGCSPNDTFTRFGFPDPVTKQGAITLSLWQGSWIAGLLVGAVVWGMILWAVIFHRKRGDKLPQQVRYNMPIEILYTVIPFVLIAVLFVYTARDENNVDAIPSNPAVTVNVTGFQWSWQFNTLYSANGTKYNVTTDGAMWNPQLTDAENQRALPLLEIPVGETVNFNLTSPDVLHAFWVPDFLFKRDVVPGHPNHFSITATKTGTFTGHCSELCGLYHSRMLFTLKIVTPAQFQTWISQQQATQSTASGSTQ
jgi:cytochrome c oxidase subunit 2